MIRVLGLDVATTIGAAWPDGTCERLRAHAGPADPARRLHELIAALSARIQMKLAVTPLDVCVLEDYQRGGRQGRTIIALAEIGGCVRLRLFEHGIPYVAINPTSLKLWATGSGKASKDDMLAAARVFNPAVRNHDEADAALLRMAGLCHYLDDPDLPPLTPAIARLPWPELVRSR